MSKPIPLEHGKYYHIYNRGVNRENVFIEARNYTHFLHLYSRYILPIADTYAYCLLRNHFHLLVRIKTFEEIGQTQPVNLGQAFSNFFNAYAKAINTAYRRTGSLFQHPFGRIEVDNDRYYMQLVIYIHQNPQRHHLIDDFRLWPYSSYGAFSSQSSSHIRRAEVLGWFNDVERFRAAHEVPVKDRGVLALIDEDFD